jgi:hypothetical protein
MTHPHLKPLVDMVAAAPCEEPPLPWRRIAAHAVGGLLAVGFAENSDTLLVVSHQGRGVFDCITGQRVARDREEDGYDPFRLEALGIGPLADKPIRMSGLDGGGLPESTADGWRVERLTLQWPLESLLLTPPGSWIYGVIYGKPHEFTKVFEDSEIRAWGFSPTGRTLLLATSSDMVIYGKGEDG